MGRAWKERASRNHVSGLVCSSPVRLDGSVLKTKQLGLVYQATMGLIFFLGCSWVVYRPAKRIKIGPNLGPLGPTKIKIRTIDIDKQKAKIK